MNHSHVKAKLAMLLVSLAAGAHAQEQAAKPTAEPLSNDCVAQAIELFFQKNGPHDGVHKSRVPLASSDDIAKLQRGGALQVRPFGFSTLTPPSSHELLVLKDALDKSDELLCPLHRMYVRFTQGGFHPQPAIYYGPLRADGS